jgi:hypothetical protein
MECVSWYRSGKDGKNPQVFPGPVSLFWWWTSWVKWSDYEILGGEKWLWERKVFGLAKWTVLGLGIAVYALWQRA